MQNEIMNIAQAVDAFTVTRYSKAGKATCFDALGVIMEGTKDERAKMGSGIIAAAIRSSDYRPILNNLRRHFPVTALKLPKTKKGEAAPALAAGQVFATDFLGVTVVLDVQDGKPVLESANTLYERHDATTAAAFCAAVCALGARKELKGHKAAWLQIARQLGEHLAEKAKAKAERAAKAIEA